MPITPAKEPAAAVSIAPLPEVVELPEAEPLGLEAALAVGTICPLTVLRLVIWPAELPVPVAVASTATQAAEPVTLGVK